MKHWMIWTAGLSVAFGIAAAPVAAADKVASRPAVSKPANPTEDWSITAVNKDSGGFDYCAAGTKVVWDVDVLREGLVRVYRADDPEHPTMFHRGETADAEPAVPGWRMLVDELFD